MIIRHPRSLAVVVLAFVLASVLLAIGCVSNSTVATTYELNEWGIKNISPEEAYDLIQANRNNPDFIILDVRLSKWLAFGYIEGAVNIPLNTSNLADFESKIAGLDKNKTYLTYCPDGCGAAAHIMNSIGFNRIYDLSGGYKSWVEKGLPIIE